MTEDLRENQVFEAQAGVEKLSVKFHTQLDRIVESDKRYNLAAEIQQAKTEMLSQNGINPDYGGELQSADGNVDFAHKDKIEQAETELCRVIHESSGQFRQHPDRKTFVRAFSAITALGELRLLGAEGLNQSQKLRDRGNIPAVGIQTAQIDAAVSMYTIHSTEVDSGQGKSNPDILIAAVARTLLTGDQVHQMVRDPQARRRDSQQLKKLTDPLGINVHVLKERTSMQYESETLRNLIATRNVILIGNLHGKQHEKTLRKIQHEIDRVSDALTLRYAKRTIASKKEDEPPQIVVGAGSDFIFRFLRHENPELWGAKRVLMSDEGDLLMTKASPHVVEQPGTDVLATYMPDWIGASIAESIANDMFSQNKISRVKDAYEFTEADSESSAEFSMRFVEEVKAIRKSGKMSGESAQIMEAKLLEMFSSLDADFRLTPSAIQAAVPALIAHFASGVQPKKALDYAFTWMQAKRLQEGTVYSADNGKTVLIDPDTGHPLPTHQFQDLLDVAVDAAAGVCSMRPRSADTVGSTGFFNYVYQAYGDKRAAIISATIKYLDDEVKQFLGKPVIESERWIGETVSADTTELHENQSEALRSLSRLLHHEGPVLIPTDNDLEIEQIREFVESEEKSSGRNRIVRIVNSKTSLAEETDIFAAAGEKNSITIANPRGGRMIDIKTTKESDEAGGLRVVAWGPFHSQSVFQQVIARTRRAGHPGDVEWITYMHGGHVGLADNPIVLQYPELTAMLRDTIPGTLSYENSVIQAIHRKQYEHEASHRLSVYLEDYIRTNLWYDLLIQMQTELRVEKPPKNSGPASRLFSRLPKTKDYAQLTTRAYNENALERLYGPAINASARALTRSILFVNGVSRYEDFMRAVSGVRTKPMITEGSAELRERFKIHLHVMSDEAQKTLGAWKISHETQGRLKRNPLILKNTQRLTALTERTVIPNGVLNISIPGNYTHDRYDVALTELPTTLLTIEIIQGHTVSKKGHRGAETREFRMHIASIDPSEDGRIASEFELKTRYLPQISRSGNRGRSAEQKFRHLLHEYFRQQKIPENTWNSLMKSFQLIGVV